MARGNYRVVSCEGGDQVGKGDAVITLCRKLSDSKIPFTYSSFPIYATPIGTVIRMFLKNGLEDFKFPIERETKLKMVLYALNRLEFLDVLLSDPKYMETLIVLDRSSFSNAVTIAYGLLKLPDCTEENVRKLVRYAMRLDGLMIGSLGLKDCVVQMVSASQKWGNLRGKDGDINERDDVQKLSGMVYDIYEKLVGKGWKKVVTRTEEGWKDREDIFSEIYNFVEMRHGKLDREDFGIEYVINIEEIRQSIYPNSKVSKADVDRYMKFLMENDKDSMYEYGIKIGRKIAKSTPNVKFNNCSVRREFKKMLNRFPEIEEIFNRYLDNGFYTKLVMGVQDE